MRFPFYKQPDFMDCGVTCLRIVTKHYGKSVSLQEIRQLSSTTREGSSLLGLSEAAEKFGFRTLAVKVGYERLLEDAPLPCIAHWNQNHFVVIYKIKKDTVYLADPAHGLLKYTKEDFLKSWKSDVNDGILLLLEPTPEFYSENSPNGLKETKPKGFSFLFKYLFRYKKLLIQLIIGLLAGSLLQLVFPFLTQSIVDLPHSFSAINAFCWQNHH